MTPSMPAVFPDWRDRSLEEVLRLCRELLEDTRYPTVGRWRAAGGKVLGHFQVYFPEELAHAAGLLPLKVRGAPLEPTRADSHFGSYLCSIIKTSLELHLSGRVALEMFVAPPICDAARNLAAVWGRNAPYPCRILYLPQNAASPAAPDYLRSEYARLLRAIEEVAERRVTAADLRSSLQVYNENRRLLRALYAVRRDRPWLIAVDEAYSLVAVGGLLPKEEHNALLAYVLPELDRRPGKQWDRLRVVLEGAFCEQPPLDLLQMIGQSCYVVDDDLLIGMRWCVEDVALGGDPLANLADAYLNRSAYSPVQHDPRKPKETMLLERVHRAGAEAVIILSAKMCEPGLEEQVTYTKALDRAGIPYFVSEFEENMTSFEHLELQLETFVENLMFA